MMHLHRANDVLQPTLKKLFQRKQCFVPHQKGKKKLWENLKFKLNFITIPHEAQAV